MMKVIYVAGKYLDGEKSRIIDNIAHAEREAMRLWQEGWAVLVPHLDPRFIGCCSEETFLKGDLEILSRCDAIYMLNNFRESKGARAEYELAVKLGKKIFLEQGDGETMRPGDSWRRTAEYTVD